MSSASFVGNFTWAPAHDYLRGPLDGHTNEREGKEARASEAQPIETQETKGAKRERTSAPDKQKPAV